MMIERSHQHNLIEKRLRLIFSAKVITQWYKNIFPERYIRTDKCYHQAWYTKVLVKTGISKKAAGHRRIFSNNK